MPKTWVMTNPVISSVIFGPRTLAHLEDVYGAVGMLIDKDDEAFINAPVVPGHASSPGYNDPAYPFLSTRFKRFLL